MSYQEKNTLVSLTNAILLLAYYLIHLARIYEAEVFVAHHIYGLWVTTVILAIIAAILSNIITQIAVAIAIAIIAREVDEGELFMDERDKLIDLKGMRNAYFVTSIGVFFALLSAVMGQPLPVMFTVLIIFAFVANIFGDASRLFLYRRGF